MPVEERIDHEAVQDWVNGSLSRWIKEAEEGTSGRALWAAQRLRSCRTQIQGLLTEYSAREKPLVDALTWISEASYTGNFDVETVVGIHRQWAKNALACLPATESAQPEEET